LTDNSNDTNSNGANSNDTNSNGASNGDTNSNNANIGDTNNDDTRFEDGLHELEEIVRTIESGEHSLEENLELFERGIALTRQCSSKLDAATQRIKKLVDENGIEEMEIN
jgi:exodeoxyribonuclease VII small subunit